MKTIYPLVVFVFVLPFLASAQNETVGVDSLYDLSIEELMQINVVTASKNSEGINDAPAVISVIKSKEIEAFGALNLVDVLNRATALYVTGSYYFP